MSPTPFTFDLDPAAVADLRDRLHRTRWPEKETVDDWSQGVPLAYARELCEYWADGYDFEAAARRLLASTSAPTGVQTITRGDDPALARVRIINALNAGPAVVNFHGHGAEDLWTSADLLARVRQVLDGATRSS